MFCFQIYPAKPAVVKGEPDNNLDKKYIFLLDTTPLKK